MCGATTTPSQASFGAAEPVSALRDFVRRCLTPGAAAAAGGWSLYTTPPKQACACVCVCVLCVCMCVCLRVCWSLYTTPPKQACAHVHACVCAVCVHACVPCAWALVCALA